MMLCAWPSNDYPDLCWEPIVMRSCQEKVKRVPSRSKLFLVRLFHFNKGNPWQLTLVFLGLNPFKYSDFFSWFKGVAKINPSWWFCCWWCAKLSQYSKPLEYSPPVPLSMAKCLMAPRLAPPHGETLTCFGTLTLGSAGTRPRPVP